MQTDNTDIDAKQSSVHKSVLLKESIIGLGLQDKNEALVIDGTFGGGGHSIEILKFYPKTKVLAIDQDARAWDRARSKFTGYEKRISFQNMNFRDLEQLSKDKEGKEMADAILLDLGLSSDQLDNSGRGFTFLKDEPLLMTMKDNPTEEDLTAKDIVNTWSEKSIADIIYGYAEERYSRRIAKAIVDHRKNKGNQEINTTGELVEIIRSAVPAKYTKGKIHFATKTFQGLRMAVNDELNSLENGLVGGWSVLKKGGVMAVISFHSLEDRIVKNFYKEKLNKGEGVFLATSGKKPIVAGEEELKNNKRARSAKLRIIQKI